MDPSFSCTPGLIVEISFTGFLVRILQFEDSFSQLPPNQPRVSLWMLVAVAVGQHQWYHFGDRVNSPPILRPILVVGLNRMFTENTIWVLTHVKAPKSDDL